MVIGQGEPFDSMAGYQIEIFNAHYALFGEDQFGLEGKNHALL